MYKSGPKWKHGGPNLGAKDIFIRFLKTWALNGGTLSLFFNENKKESLGCSETFSEKETKKIHY